MDTIDLPRRSSQPERWRAAAGRFRAILEDRGWTFKLAPPESGSETAFLIRRGSLAYAVELKTASEGRNDRLVPLLAQAALEISQVERRNARRMAVVSAPRVPMAVAEHVLAFAAKYIPHEVAVGVFDLQGLSVFRGPGLETLNAQPSRPLRSVGSGPSRNGRWLFSDLNQWMLKVLLANELPEPLLSAPRGRYRNASQLARAAHVSVMSAFRFIEQLRKDSYVDDSGSSLQLVRRESLFKRWQAVASARAPHEISMRFRLSGNGEEQLRRIVSGNRACLALFAAADALKLGFVTGVPAYVYMERVDAATIATWKALRPCEAGESPDVVVRQAPAPQSIFRATVTVDGVAASDVVQVWLDVGSHPSRGVEQAEFIRRRVLEPMISHGA
jgi:hypothetical protein